MVRLGVKNAVKSLGNTFFQFQHGTIGSMNKYRAGSDLETLSIPAWYDWEFFAAPMHQQCIFPFNSSMVRLGVSTTEKSTLKNYFQFQHGTIGSFHPRDNGFMKSSFNSSMVRLGVSISPRNYSRSKCFQFQHGTIGSRINGLIQIRLLPFNSSMVRLGGCQLC